MHKIILFLILIASIVFSDVIMKKPDKEKPDISLPIEKPTTPVIPIYRPVIVHQDNYYNSNYIENCNQYIEIISQKDREIKTLTEELETLRKKEHIRLQKKLKATHEAEIEKFEKRKSTGSTTNSITISQEAIE